MNACSDKTICTAYKKCTGCPPTGGMRTCLLCRRKTDKGESVYAYGDFICVDCGVSRGYPEFEKYTVRRTITEVCWRIRQKSTGKFWNGNRFTSVGKTYRRKSDLTNTLDCSVRWGWSNERFKKTDVEIVTYTLQELKSDPIP